MRRDGRTRIPHREELLMLTDTKAFSGFAADDIPKAKRF